MKRILCCLAVLTSYAYSQGTRYDNRILTPSQSGPPGASAPIMTTPYAQITVCASPSVGSPCTNLVAIYSNAGLSVRASNPITTDATGSFGFFVAPGNYSYSVRTQQGKVVGTFPFTAGGASGGGTSLPIGATGTAPVSNGTAFVNQAVVLSSALGQQNGVPTLDQTAKIPIAQLPAILPVSPALVVSQDGLHSRPAIASDVTAVFSGTGTCLLANGTKGACGSGATVPVTPKLLAGDGAGNAIAATPSVVTSTLGFTPAPNNAAQIGSLFTGGQGYLKADGTTGPGGTGSGAIGGVAKDIQRNADGSTLGPSGITSDATSQIAVNLPEALSLTDPQTVLPFYGDYSTFYGHSKTLNTTLPYGSGKGSAYTDLIRSRFFAPGYDFGVANHFPTTGGWSIGKSLNIDQVSYMQGINQAITTNNINNTIGDVANNYGYLRAYGGTVSSADEGVTAQVIEGGQTSQIFAGSVASSPDNQHVVVNCTQECDTGPSTGGAVIDMSTSLYSGKVVFEDGSNKLLTVSPATLTPPTFVGDLSGDVVVPPANQTGTSIQMYMNKDSGTADITKPFFFACDNMEESVVATAVTAPDSTHYFITAPILYPHDNGCKVLQGGTHGSMDIVADQRTPLHLMRTDVPVYAISASQFFYRVYGRGGQLPAIPAAAHNFAQSGGEPVIVRPRAVVQSVGSAVRSPGQNQFLAFNGALNLMANDNSWNGHNVEIPVPQITAINMFNIYGYFNSPYYDSHNANLQATGVGVSNGWFNLALEHGNPDSMYQSYGGKYTEPYAGLLMGGVGKSTGLMQNGIVMRDPAKRGIWMVPDSSGFNPATGGAFTALQVDTIHDPFLLNVDPTNQQFCIGFQTIYNICNTVTGTVMHGDLTLGEQVVAPGSPYGGFSGNIKAAGSTAAFSNDGGPGALSLGDIYSLNRVTFGNYGRQTYVGGPAQTDLTLAGAGYMRSFYNSGNSAQYGYLRFEQQSGTDNVPLLVGSFDSTHTFNANYGLNAGAPSAATNGMMAIRTGSSADTYQNCATGMVCYTSYQSKPAYLVGGGSTTPTLIGAGGGASLPAGSGLVKTTNGTASTAVAGTDFDAPGAAATAQAKSFANTVVNEENYSGADVGARVNAAIASLPILTLNSQPWAAGTVRIPGGPCYSDVTTINITSPFVRVIGDVGTCLNWTAAAGGDVIRISAPTQITGPSGTQPNMGPAVEHLTIYNLYTGSNASNGIHAGDLQKIHIADVAANNFTNTTTSAGFWFDNVNFFTEGLRVNDATGNNNSIGMRWTMTTGSSTVTNSFGYGVYSGLRFQARTNQIGYSIETGTFLYHSSFQGIVETSDATGIGMYLSGTGTFGGNAGPNTVSLFGECVAGSACTGAVILKTDSTAKFDAIGSVNGLGTTMTTSIPAPTGSGQFHLKGPSQVGNDQTYMDYGTDGGLRYTFAGTVNARMSASDFRFQGTSGTIGFSSSPAGSANFLGITPCAALSQILCVDANGSGIAFGNARGGIRAATGDFRTSLQVGGGTPLTTTQGSGTAVMSATGSWNAGNLIFVDPTTNAAADSTVALTAVPRYVGTITTTNNTSDAITVAGLTTAGHCFGQQTSTGTNLAFTVQSGSAAVTLTHPTTSGVVVDLYCAVK